MGKKTISRYTTPDIPVLQSSDLHPILKRIYANRGIHHLDQLNMNLKDLLPFHDLLNIKKAVSYLYETLQKQENILIVGDYDVDGATSTALMILGLRALGAKNVDYLVPNRFLYGYGLGPEIVTLAATKNPNLIITVDNGISSITGVNTATDLGIKVIITDHHLAGETLPEATAIINPNQPNDNFASKNLAGVGVAFYVLLALRAKLRKENWFDIQDIPEPNLATYLDLVALGTIADLVPMDKNNRILVHQGLKRIQSGKCRLGIKLIAQTCNKKLSNLVTSDLSYIISPRLNAAGRLDDMSLGIACLVSENTEEVKKMVLQLNDFNQERKDLESSMRKDAFQLLKKIDLDNKKKSSGLCLSNDTWHQGVVGILASRIKDRLHRPVIVFAKHNEDELKGSARSIEELHIRDVLDTIAVQTPGLITKFGGHALAAGLTLQRKSYDLFSRLFNEEVTRRLEGKTLHTQIMSDGELSPSDFCLDITELLRQAAPWGKDFPDPIFDGKFRLLEQQIFAQKHLKLTLKLDDQLLNAVAFNIDTELWPDERCEFVRMAYRLDLDEYQGRRKVRLLVEYMEPI